MPDSKDRSQRPPRPPVITTDDTLVRLVLLPEADRLRILDNLVRQVDRAEKKVIAREARC